MGFKRLDCAEATEHEGVCQGKLVLQERETIMRYIVFAEDVSIDADVVFYIEANSPGSARGKVLSFYKQEGWDTGDIKHVRTVRLLDGQEVQNVGKTLRPLGSLHQKEMTAVCKKLLEAAQVIEGNSGDTTYRDELVSFLNTIPEGKQVVEAYYAPQYASEAEVQ